MQVPGLEGQRTDRSAKNKIRLIIVDIYLQGMQSVGSIVSLQQASDILELSTQLSLISCALDMSCIANIPSYFPMGSILGYHFLGEMPPDSPNENSIS